MRTSTTISFLTLLASASWIACAGPADRSDASAIDGAIHDAPNADRVANGDSSSDVPNVPIDATPPAPHGSYFEPVAMPTAMTVPTDADPPLLPGVINTSLTRIGTSEYHEFFIVEGHLRTIGSNRSGEMGVGDAAPAVYVNARDVAVPSDTTFVEVAAGGYQSVAVDSTGRVWSWGNDIWGARGDGSVADPTLASMSRYPDRDGQPVQLTVDAAGANFGGAADPVIQVVSTLWYNAALTTSGNVYVWGFNGDDHAGNDSRGIVGDGQPVSTDACVAEEQGPSPCHVRRPTRVIFPAGTTIRRFAASASMLVAIDANGDLWTWGGGGGNGYGLGVGDRGATGTQSSTPLHLMQGRDHEDGSLGPLPHFVDVTTNTNTNYAIDEAGDLWGWGIAGPALGVGTGTWNPQGYPVKLTRSGNANYSDIDALLASGRRARSIQVSLNSAHVLLDDGSLWGWGDAAMGEVGDGHIVNYLSVMPDGAGHNNVRDAWDWGATRATVQHAVRVLTHVRSFATSAFSFHVMAIRDDGTIYSWGRNANGVLGNHLDPLDRSQPYLARFAPFGADPYTPNILDVPVPTWVQPF